VKSAQGTPVTFTAAVSADHAATGTVDFLDAGTAIATGVPLSAGRATATTSNLRVGTHSITASYSGDSMTGKATTPSALLQVITGNFVVQVSGNSGSLNHFISLNITLQ
jgi:hypothetical protein